MGLSPIAAAKGSGFIKVLQMEQQVFYMRCFAGSSGREVSNTDNRKIEANGFEKFTVVQKVTECDNQPVYAGYWIEKKFRKFKGFQSLPKLFVWVIVYNLPCGQLF